MSPETLGVPDERLQKHSTPAGLDYEELGGYGIRVINNDFFKKSFKLQTEDRRTRKTELILSLIHQINLRLGGYSIWSASTSRTTYQDRFGA